MIYKKSVNEKISEKIVIERFLDFSTEDFPDKQGLFNPSKIPSEIFTRNSDNMVTLPIIYGLLNNRNISHLSGKFKYYDNNFEIQINVYPTVEVNSDIFVKSVYCINAES